jgi:hypothetical protein
MSGNDVLPERKRCVSEKEHILRIRSLSTLQPMMDLS